MNTRDTWGCVTAAMTARTPIPHLIDNYLARTGWAKSSKNGWTTTQYGSTAWLPAIPPDAAAEIPALPPGTLNGLVQRQLAQLDIERDNTVIDVLLRLELLEGRSWTAIWTDIAGPSDVPNPAPPTLAEQAARIAADLNDLDAYIEKHNSITGQWWPSVAVNIDADTVITAYPTRRSDVPLRCAQGIAGASTSDTRPC
ncbi:hypothetical protein ACQP2U_43540 (plasmid) [Nocardia sp. CA-084685]|uniref:hypothetical protein n=1 Tax=Nocardia sp. CA-084685 TaxID=3239970 RepID=UPI003D96DCDF